MPLVVPGINSAGSSSKTDDWMNKLAGKKIGETSDNVVSSGRYFLCSSTNENRRLPKRIFLKSTESSSREIWSPRISIQTGDIVHFDSIKGTVKLTFTID